MGAEIIIYNDSNSARLDKFLQKKLEISRTKIQKLIHDGSILVNNKICKNNQLLVNDDQIAILKTESITNRHDNIQDENISLDIIYEDQSIIVINKPKNMVVHISNGHHSGTLVNALKYHFQNDLANSNDLIRPGIVHRIDKDTTGILVVAKTDTALLNLQAQFRDHTIIRKYTALVHTNLADDFLKIDLPIARSVRNRQKMDVVEGGKRAITIIKKIASYPNHSLLECELYTGRTHQIRVHLSYLKAPLVGDHVYGLAKDKKMANGQFLCATYLGFMHPETDKFVEFTIKIPQYFQSYLDNLLDN